MSGAGEVSIIDASLIAICIESLLYGTVCLLFVTSTYLHVNRQRFDSSVHTSCSVTKLFFILRAIMCPMFVGSVLLFTFVSAHWITNVYRLFQAFKLFNGGQTPAALYLDLAQTTNVVKNIFTLAALLMGDAMLIYRLFIVWNFNLRVIAIPVCTFIGLAACGISLEYQFSHARPGARVFDSGMDGWITADVIFIICTNVYCTVLIVYRIWGASSSAKQFGGRKLMSILAIIVESAAIYAAWSVAYLVVYEAGSVMQFFITDTLGQVSALATFLINVRVGVTCTLPNDPIPNISFGLCEEVAPHRGPVSTTIGPASETV